jgi:hypothetical protein
VFSTLKHCYSVPRQLWQQDLHVRWSVLSQILSWRLHRTWVWGLPSVSWRCVREEVPPAVPSRYIQGKTNGKLWRNQWFQKLHVKKWISHWCVDENANICGMLASWPTTAFTVLSQVQGQFAEFVDSPYYSELELCGGAVNYLPWQAIHFLQHLSTSQKCTADCWSLQNFLSQSSLFMIEKAQKLHGARYELNSVFSLEKVDWWNPIRTSAIQSRSHPMWFLGFSNHEKGAPRQEISKWSTVCSMFLRSGRSVVRSASLAKGGT